MSDRLIATIAIGDEATAIRRWSEPLLQAYAHVCGAELLYLNKTFRSRDTGKPAYEKFQLADLLNRYDRILFIDTDILVSPESPNLFNLVPDSHLGAVSVESVYKAVEKEKVASEEILGPLQWSQPYFNSGVILFSQRHREMLESGAQLIDRWHKGKLAQGIEARNDQTIFNYCLNTSGGTLHDLGPSFNFTRAWGRFHERFRHYFIHYAGLTGNRDWQMRRDYRILTKHSLRRLHARAPIATWLLDRIEVASRR